MKIVHRSTGQIVAEVNNNKAKIYDKNLEREWQITGIAIPHLLRNQYAGEKVIRLDHPLFSKALGEVYYPLNMSHELFELRPELRISD